MKRICRVDVVEEVLIARAEVVEPRLALRCRDEAVLRATAVAGEADVAVEAVLRQRLALVESELPLLRRAHQLEHVRHLDVAELVPGLDEVVAGVEVAGVLECEREAAGLGVDAEAGVLTCPVGERHVEHLHVDLTHVAADPLLEDVDQEAAVLFAGDRAVGDVCSVLRVERPIAPGAPRHGAVLGRLGDPLDDRDELDKACAALVPEEAVDLASVVGVGGVDRRQGVPLDPGFLKEGEPTHDLVERTRAALVDAVGVVELLRAVDREPDQEVVLFEEGGPLVVEQRAVGLDGVVGALARRR
jgi:hypothetical protein